MPKCFMCGSPIARGILCEKCDTPRRKDSAPKASTATRRSAPERATESKPVEPATPAAAPPAPTAKPATPAAAKAAAPGRSPASGARAAATPAPRPAAPRPAQQTDNRSSARAAAAPATPEPDPFPEAPVVPFPVEAASPALTSVASILVAAGVPSILVGADRSIKFVSDEAKRLFDVHQSEMSTLAAIEAKTGLRIGELSVPVSTGLRIRETNVLYSLVPLSGGATGAVLMFRFADSDSARAPFVRYVRETVLGPLRALRESMVAASRTRSAGDPLLTDAASTLDQILSSLELAPEVGDTGEQVPVNPTVTDVVHQVAARFKPFADLKGIQLQVDVQELEERFRDSDQLADALGILMDNALHYVPAGGQVVIGVRWMEHKNRPLLLFFTLDNGPVVPEELRHEIFEPGFVWDPQSPKRTGRSLFRAREFAIAHQGSVWVESKTGKACTFFLRVRPDGA